MAEKFDTSWFKLENYEGLKTMSVEGWQQLLGERYEFQGIVDDYKRSTLEYLQKMGFYRKCEFVDSSVPSEELINKIAALLKQGVITNFGLGFFPVLCTPKNPMASGCSVNNLTVQDVVEMSKDYRLHYNIDTPNIEEIQERQKHFQEMLPKSSKFRVVIPNSEEILQERQKQRQELLSGSFDAGHYGTAKIKIDLYATDAKLRKDFDQWLKHIRESTGYNDNIHKKKSKPQLSNKELYTKKDFDKWIRQGVIPYIDLMLIAEIEDKEITQAELGEKIFPNDLNVNTTDRICQVTKPLADELIQNKMHKTLLAQLVDQNPPA